MLTGEIQLFEIKNPLHAFQPRSFCICLVLTSYYSSLLTKHNLLLEAACLYNRFLSDGYIGVTATNDVYRNTIRFIGSSLSSYILVSLLAIVFQADYIYVLV